MNSLFAKNMYYISNNFSIWQPPEDTISQSIGVGMND